MADLPSLARSRRTRPKRSKPWGGSTPLGLRAVRLRELVRQGRLYLAQPPLFRLTHGAKTVYALDEEDREKKLAREFKPNAKVDVGRFKGLGEMNAGDLKQTTMDPATRTLARVKMPMDGEEGAEVADLFDRLMGKKAEPRFRFIQENAAFVGAELDV